MSDLNILGHTQRTRSTKKYFNYTLKQALISFMLVSLDLKTFVAWHDRKGNATDSKQDNINFIDRSHMQVGNLPLGSTVLTLRWRCYKMNPNLHLSDCLVYILLAELCKLSLFIDFLAPLAVSLTTEKGKQVKASCMNTSCIEVDH